jgi:hypothetical protein
MINLCSAHEISFDAKSPSSELNRELLLDTSMSAKTCHELTTKQPEWGPTY